MLLRLTYNYICSILKRTPFFMHISPLIKCNLKCSYCYQYNNNSKQMSLDQFTKILNHFAKNNLGIMSFTGGEPLIWNHIYSALLLCKKKRIVTQITTNGTFLTKKNIDKLANAGLDILSVSLDGYDESKISDKTIYNNPQLMNKLNYAIKHKIQVTCNFVLTEYNIDQLYKIVDLLRFNNIPLSIGFFVPSPSTSGSYISSNLISKIDEYKKVINFIFDKKNQGYGIIEPLEYFKQFLNFIEGKYTWDCNLAKKNTIQISSNGEVYWCSKLNYLSGINFDEISSKTYNDYKLRLSKIISKCNAKCFSNCAYNSFYYHSHKFQFIKDIVFSKYLFARAFKFKRINSPTPHLPKPRPISIKMRE